MLRINVVPSAQRSALNTRFSSLVYKLDPRASFRAMSETRKTPGETYTLLGCSLPRPCIGWYAESRKGWLNPSTGSWTDDRCSRLPSSFIDIMTAAVWAIVRSVIAPSYAGNRPSSGAHGSEKTRSTDSQRSELNRDEETRTSGDYTIKTSVLVCITRKRGGGGVAGM